MNIISTLTNEFKLTEQNTTNTVSLLDEGNTIPFIARYRKELTGELDDQVLRDLADRLNYLRNLEKRKEEVLGSMEEQGVLTEELSVAVANAETLAAVEDIYRPYKPKRKTRASVAIEKGLAPLAEILLLQDPTIQNILEIAQEYLSEEKEVFTAEDAIEGAKDIIAEQVSDSADVRKDMRVLLWKNGFIRSSATKDEDSVYANYYDYSEPISKIAGHRVLALNRGEKEDLLKITVELPAEEGITVLEKHFLKGQSPAYTYISDAIADSYSRLLFPSLEREIRSDLTDTAASGAIKVFSQNLRQLLLQPPIKGKTCMAFDPGYRNGCKLAVVDPFGKVLTTDVIYPVPPFSKIEQSRKTVETLVKKHAVEVFAIGNGTASKETEIFAVETIKECNLPVTYVMVNEAGASVYSASKLGATEFPDMDVNVRSAVSIARRLQDPLAELVKIDPKAVGVGQYQHDMPKQKLDEALTGVVESCVNSVGVDLNTASASLLSYIAGLSPSVAKNIVEKRENEGAFSSRKELLKVNKLGPKAYEQCAGFLRITESKEPFDATSVHPESYGAAKQLLDMFGYTPADVRLGKIVGLNEKVTEAGKTKVAEQIGVGVPTLTDIIAELLKPGRDIRDDLSAPILRSDIMDMEDLTPGMQLTGTVRNVIDFGAFVDIGVHQDGLVHISQIADKFIKHPGDVLKVGDVVTVWVISVDVAKHRISLTMKDPNKIVS